MVDVKRMLKKGWVVVEMDVSEMSDCVEVLRDAEMLRDVQVLRDAGLRLERKRLFDRTMVKARLYSLSSSRDGRFLKRRLAHRVGLPTNVANTSLRRRAMPPSGPQRRSRSAVDLSLPPIEGSRPPRRSLMNHPPPPEFTR
jgi:hypothetical protein